MGTRVLLAGATGAVGREVARLLGEQGHFVRALSRSPVRAQALAGRVSEVVTADATEGARLAGVMDGIEIVVSCLGASVGLGLAERRGYERLDTPANANLITAARAAGVRRFVYLGAHVLPSYAHTRYVRAHEAVGQALATSGLGYTIVRPTGIFSALAPFLDLARKGLVTVVGDGRARTNPVHPVDVAEAVVAHLSGGPTDLSVGGPDVLSRAELAEAAFTALGRRPRLIRIPAWIFRASGAMLRPLHPRLGDLLQFVAAVSVVDAVAPAVGKRRLGDYFAALCAPAGP
jgi:uncharacterized protein YbjT (DUF2867 family)